MNIRLSLRAAVSLAVFTLCSLVAAGVAGSAPVVVPPAGTPDLSQMVLQTSDFSAATIADEGYQQPSTDFVAVYDRDFGPSTTTTGATFATVFSEVNLASNVPAAQTFLLALNLGLNTKSGRMLLAREVAHQLGKKVKVKSIRVGRPVNLSVGDGGLLLAISMPVRGTRVSADLVVVQRDRVVGMLVLASLTKIKVADASALATTMVSHIDAVLSPQNPPPPPSPIHAKALRLRR